jgi:DnaK suppressor protein
MIAVGSLTIYTEGLFVVLAIAAASYVFWREGLRRRYPSEELFDLILIALLGGIFGSRLLYFLVTKDLTVVNFLTVFRFWQSSGALWYGALLGGGAAGILWSERERFDLLEILDIGALAATLGQAVYLLGTHPWEAPFFFLLFLLLKSLPEKLISTGITLSLYFLLASLLRFVAAFFRVEKTYLFGVNFDQAVSILFLILGVLGLRQTQLKGAQERREMLKNTVETIKTTIDWPRRKFADVRSRLSSEERHLKRHQRELKRDDPLLEPGRTVGNAELGDEASEEISHRESEAFRGVFRARLKQVQNALKRVKSGQYGICEVCGKKIDPARLKVDPSITVCLHCQKKKELTSG